MTEANRPTLTSTLYTIDNNLSFSNFLLYHHTRLSQKHGVPDPSAITISNDQWYGHMLTCSSFLIHIGWDKAPGDTCGLCQCNLLFLHSCIQVWLYMYNIVIYWTVWKNDLILGTFDKVQLEYKNGVCVYINIHGVYINIHGHSDKAVELLH